MTAHVRPQVSSFFYKPLAALKRAMKFSFKKSLYRVLDFCKSKLGHTIFFMRTCWFSILKPSFSDISFLFYLKSVLFELDRSFIFNIRIPLHYRVLNDDEGTFLWPLFLTGEGHSPRKRCLSEIYSLSSGLKRMTTYFNQV